MRKLVLLASIALAVFAVASAHVPTLDTDAALAETPAAVEQVAADCAANAAAELDLEALLAQDVGGVCVDDSAEDSFLMAKRGGGGENCGGTICGRFQYCCNPSCGTCVYYGMSCTQQSCN